MPFGTKNILTQILNYTFGPANSTAHQCQEMYVYTNVYEKFKIISFLKSNSD